MTMGTDPDKKGQAGPKKRTPKGKARFEVDGDDKTLAVHLDRQGFRRLLETLERLAATGEHQVFEKSGRGRSAGNGDASPDKLIFHITAQDR